MVMCGVVLVGLSMIVLFVVSVVMVGFSSSRIGVLNGLIIKVML